ncbi:MAG: GNAT family N-acetyltransferase [Hamadaea sp.]|nr:GNAT family N-acetyltransferase [Hamadaea sp.]
MSITIREVTSDADYQAWRSVRVAVFPAERTATVEELRARAAPERLLVLAERDGALVAAGALTPSSIGDAGSLAPWVLPGVRRQGIGSRLLDHLTNAARERGFPVAAANADDPGSARFAEHFGFAEVDRQIEQVRVIGAEPPAQAPDGVDIVCLADRPELWRQAYHQVALDGFADMAVTAPMQVTLDEWESSDWLGDPAATFLALDAQGAVIGLAGLVPDADVPDRAENAFTTVRRDWRGKGVAAAVKRATLHWAAQHGLREVYTWTQRGNADMRRLNEHLGYVTRTESIRFEKPL